MTNDQRNREEKREQKSPGQDEHRKADKGGHGRADANRSEQDKPQRRAGQEDPTNQMATEKRNRETDGGQKRQGQDQQRQGDKGKQGDDKNRRQQTQKGGGSSQQGRKT
jgi:hypothetical protein